MKYGKAGTSSEEVLYVRVMPGSPKSPNPSQRKPYIIQRKGNMAVSKTGELVPLDVPEAHIPLAEFEFKGW